MVVNPPNYVVSEISEKKKEHTELIGNEVTANIWRSYKPAEIDARNCIRFSSRIIYTGTSSPSAAPRYMFDYQDRGKSVKCRTLLKEQKKRLQQKLHEVQQRMDGINQMIKSSRFSASEIHIFMGF